MRYHLQHNSFTISTLGVAEYDDAAACSVRQERRHARILVADYARYHGLHDPDDIARFATDCVQLADERLARRDRGVSDLTLSAVAIRVAAERRRGERDRTPDMHSPLHSAQRTCWMPATCERRMPEQPLGELWSPTSPEVWRRIKSQLASMLTVAWSKIGLD